MQAFCLYAINFYDEALESLNRYLIQYPADENKKYAKYLIAIIFTRKSKMKKETFNPF